MIEPIKKRGPIRKHLLLGLGVVALALVGFGVSRLGKGNDAMALSQVSVSHTTAPSLDAEQPTRTETATFALG